MSIDNGVYIIKNKKGYRVIGCQCIENLWWWLTKNKDTKEWQQRDKINPKVVEEYFKDSKYYKTREGVYKRAIELYDKAIKDYGMVEYGIQDLGVVGR